MLSRRSHRRAAPAPVADGVVLGRRLGSGRPLPVDDRSRLVWPFAQMRRHLLVLGASGSGKTETSLAIAHQVAERTDAALFYLDAKGDRETAARFCSIAEAAGRRPQVFPNRHFDAWRGDWRAIVNRLLEVIRFADSGPAAYYRDIAKTALQLACRHPDGPPRSSEELLGRLDYEALLDAHGPNNAVLSLPRERVGQVRLRYQSFFGQLGSQLDGQWSFEDVDCAYLMLDSVALGEDTASLASLLFTDFAHYFSQRKPREPRCVIICDEFAAISRASDLAIKVEQARAFNTSLILVPQTLGGLGEEWQLSRILGSVETLIVHSLNEPERVADLAGHRTVPELTHRIEAGLPAYAGLSRNIQRPVVPHDRIRDLPVGQAWLIRRGRAARVAIDPAPHLDAVPLPPSDPIDPPLERVETQLPRQIGYLEDD